MNTIDKLRAHLANPPLDEDGEPAETKLLPGLSPDEIAEIESSIGLPLDLDTKELLSFSGGLEEGPMEIINFKGKQLEEVGISYHDGRMCEISPDGFGNFWFYWIPQLTSKLGPIYYFQHEGPMIFYQSPTLIHFVDECLRFMQPPHESLIDDVHEFRIKPIKELNLDLKEKNHEDVMKDSILREFSVSLPEDALIYDFRSAQVGDGIDLKDLEVLSFHKSLPIFAVRKKLTLFQRLMGIKK